MQSFPTLKRLTDMSKKKQRKQKPKVATSKQSTANSITSVLNRRNALKLLIGVPVAGAAGAAIHRYDVQNRGLHDLTSVGQGRPTIVQVHDPACQICKRLMNNTRKALKDRDDIVYRVADITTSDGAEFQQKHHSAITTLLLFDENGKRVGTVQGVTPVNELKDRFKAL